MLEYIQSLKDEVIENSDKFDPYSALTQEMLKLKAKEILEEEFEKNVSTSSRRQINSNYNDGNDYQCPSLYEESDMSSSCNVSIYTGVSVADDNLTIITDEEREECATIENSSNNTQLIKDDNNKQEEGEITTAAQCNNKKNKKLPLLARIISAQEQAKEESMTLNNVILNNYNNKAEHLSSSSVFN